MGVIFRNGKPYGGAASSTDEIYYIDDNGNRITLTEEIEVLKQSCQYDLDSKIDKTEKGSKNGVAELDGTGKVPSDQLPSYVDDVIEGYYNSNDENFYLDEEYTENIKGEEGKIYIDLITNGSYRYAIKSNKFIKITSGYIGGKTDYGTIIIDGNSILLDQAVGMSTENHEYEIDGEVISSKNGAEIFNDYQHNIALGDYSHSEGLCTIAASDEQHVQGKYNIKDTESKYAFIIGNGTSNDNRSNAIAIDWDGNIICYGDEISINEQVDNNTRKLSGIDDNANNYIHPTHTSHSKSMYKFANDGLGHISDAEPVTKDDIVGLGIPGQDTNTTYGITLSDDKCNVVLDENSNNSSIYMEGYVRRYTALGIQNGLYVSSIGYVQSCVRIIFRQSQATIGGRIGAGCAVRISARSETGSDGFTAYVSPVDNNNNAAPLHNLMVYGFLKLEKIYADQSNINGAVIYKIAIVSSANPKEMMRKNYYFDVEVPLFGAEVEIEGYDIKNYEYINLHYHKPISEDISESVSKLSRIEDNANNYVHPTTSGNKHIPSGGSSGQILRWSADGTAVWGDDKDTKYSNATQSASGLMTAADKKKLDGMDLTKYLHYNSQGDMIKDTWYKFASYTCTQSYNYSTAIFAAGFRYDVIRLFRITAGTANGKPTAERIYLSNITGDLRGLVGYTINGNTVNFFLKPSTNIYGYIGRISATAERRDFISQTDLIAATTAEAASIVPFTVAGTEISHSNHSNETDKISNGTLRSGFYVNDAANATTGHVWFRMATCKISGAYETVNTTFLITNGMAGHALLSCGIRNDGTGKAAESCSLNFSARNGSIAMPSDMFRVVAINSSTGVTYELWGQITARWQGVRYTVLDERNISGGKYNIWKLESHSDADAKTAPTTGNYYVNSSDISVCATANKANEATTLTDSGWRTLADKVKYRKIGNIVEVRGTYTAPSSGGGMTIGTLPSGYRPSNARVYNTNSISDTASKTYYTSVSTAGVVIISGMSGSTFTKDSTYNVNIMFMVG